MKLMVKAYLRIAAEDWRDKYDRVAFFSGGLFAVELDGKYGFVDQTGNEVVEPKYDYVWGFSEGLAQVKFNRMYGFVDQQGNEVVEPMYNWVSPFFQGLAKVELGDKKGWVTREGKELLITEDKHIQIKNLIELEKITEEDLINWINERAVKRNY